MPLKVRIKIKIELTEIKVKNWTNLRDKFAKILKRKQDYRWLVNKRPLTKKINLKQLHLKS